MTATRSSFVKRYLRSPYDGLWLVAITVIAIVVRASPLRQPVSYDEAYTFLNFVNRGFTDLFSYVVPNNHVLSTLLIRLTTLAFGKSPLSIRIPSFLAGVASVPLTFCLCRRLMPEASGYVATAAMSIFTFMVYYSTMARGYTLVVLLSLLLALVGLEVVERPSWIGRAVMAVVGALGMLAIPTMLYALGAIYLWLALIVLTHRRSWRAVAELIIPCGILTCLLTWLVYLPTIEISGLPSLTANTFVQALTWDRFVAGLAPHLHTTLKELTWNTPPLVPALCAAAIVVGMVAAAYQRNWPVFFLAPAIVIGSAAVLVMKRSIPYPRTWIYLIPFALVAADAGVTCIVQVLPRAGRVLVAILVLGVAGMQAASLVSKRTIADAADFPDGARIVQALRTVMSRDDVVHVNIPIDWQTYFYMWRYDVPDKARTDVRTHEFFVVEKRAYVIRDLTAAPVVLVAAFGDGELYRLREPGEK